MPFKYIGRLVEIPGMTFNYFGQIGDMLVVFFPEKVGGIKRYSVRQVVDENDLRHILIALGKASLLEYYKTMLGTPDESRQHSETK